MMKYIILLVISILPLLSDAQKPHWVPFHWESVKRSGRTFDKAAILVPVTIDNLPHRFNMQHDLGATSTVFYGNSIDPYLNRYQQLKNKLDSSLTFYIQSQKNIIFKGVNLKAGTVSLKNINIGYFKSYGDTILVGSIDTPSEKHIGTIGSDIFQGKILIIDYPRRRFAMMDDLPKKYKKAYFQPFQIKDGRIKIPLTINGNEEFVMFDT